MSTTIDERVVEMRFDNKQFEANVQTSISTLDKLKNSLNLNGAAKGLESINDSAKKCDMSTLSKSVETVNAKFSALEVVAMTALANITNSAVNAGKRLISSFTVEPIASGFSEYELKMGSIQTIMAGTGESLDRVNEKLDELNTYSDKTIYSFADMTTNIGKFTNAGVKLDDAVAAIQGVSNVAAVSGANAAEASRAMYNFAQALSAGYVKLIDWKSIENANMATVEFKNQLLETAVAAGTVTKTADGMYQVLTKNGQGGTMKETISATRMFNDSLAYQWMTTEVLTNTLKDYADETTAIGRKAFAAAQDVKTFSQLMDTLKESAQSGWAETWQIIVGDFEEAKGLFTQLSEFFGDMISASAQSRNTLLRGAMMSGWDRLKLKLNAAGIAAGDFQEKLIEVGKTSGKLTDEMLEKAGSFEKSLKSGWVTSDIFSETLKNFVDDAEGAAAALDGMSEKFNDYKSVADKVISGEFGHGQQIVEGLTKAGYDYATVQELVQQKMFGTEVRLGELSAAQLSVIGYTDEEIQKIQELDTAAGLASGPVESLINVFTEPSGRSLMIETLTNSLASMKLILDVVKHAWSDTFTPISSDGLFGALKTVRNMSAYIRYFLSDVDTIDKLTRSFKGLFAVFDIFVTVTGGLVYNIFNAIGQALWALNPDVLGFTANIGDALVALRDWIDEHNIFVHGINTLVKGLNAVLPILKSWVDQFMAMPEVQINLQRFLKAFENTSIKIKEYLEGGKEQLRAFIERVKSLDGISLENLKKIFADFRTNVVGYFLDFGWVLGDLSTAIDAFRDDVDGALNSAANGAKTTFQKIVQFTVNFKDKVFEVALDLRSKLADKIGFGEIFALGLGAAMVGFTKKISDALSVLAEPFEGLGQILKGASKVLNAFAAEIKSKALVNKSKALMNVAKAVLILVGALTVLTLLDQEKLKGALVILGLLAAGMTALAFAMSKIGNFKDTIKLSTSLISLGTSLLLLANAMKILETLDGNKTASSLIILGTLAAGLVAVSKLLSSEKKTFTTGAAFILSFSLSLNLIASALKSLSKLDTSNVGQTMTLLLGAMASLALVAAACRNVKFGAAATVLAIVISLKLLAGCFKDIAKIDIGKARSSIGTFVTIFGMFGALMVASQFAGENASKVGSAILKMSAALILITTAFKMMAGISPLDLDRATETVSKLLLVFSAITAASYFAGKNASKAGSMLLMMSGAILILSTTMVVLAHLDPSGLDRALGAITTLLLVFSAMVGITYFAKDSSKVQGTLIVLTVAVSAMVAAIAALSLLNPERLRGATTALTSLMAIFSLLVASTHFAKKAGGTLMIMTGVIAGLSGILGLMSAFDVQNATANATALSILLTSMSAALLILSKASAIAPTAYAAIGIMTAVVTGLAVILGVMDELGVEASIETAASLSILLLSLSGACLILSGVGATGPAAFVGIGALATLIAGLGGIMAAICALTADNPTVEEDLDRAIMVMEKIGTGLGAALGGFIGGALGGLSSGLPIIGANLAGFMTNAQPFFDTVKGIDSDSMNGVKALAETLLILTGVNVAEGLTSWLIGGTSLAKFGAQLVPFGEAMCEFSQSITGMDADSVTSAAIAGKTLAEMAATLPNSGGVLGFFAGENDMESFGSQLGSFGKAMVNFAAVVKGMDTDAVTNAAIAGKTMAEMATTLPNSGGVVGFFAGENDMDAFGAQLVPFGRALKNYSIEVKGLDADAVTNSATAGKAMAELANTLPNCGGLIGFLIGENNLDTFGGQLLSFGNSIKDYSIAVSGMNADAVTNSATAGQALVELAKTIPNCGGLISFFTGDNDIASFGNDIVTFGNKLGEYAVAIADVKPDVVVASANAAQALSNLAEGLPDSSLFDQWFGGDQTLATFGDDIADFGDAMGDYYSEISSLDIPKMNGVVAAVWSLVDLAKGVKDIDKKSFSNFSNSLTSLANSGMTGFVNAFENSKSDVTNAVSAMIGYAKTAIQSSTPTVTKEVISAGTTIVAGATDEIRKKRPDFVSCGTYLMQGLAQGIRAGRSTVVSATIAMANATENAARDALGVHSPSTVFKAIGGFLAGGLATGIAQNAPDAASASVDMGNSVTESINSVLGNSGSSAGSAFAESIASGISKNKSPETAAKDKAQAIADTFKAELDKLDLDMTTKDLELSLWQSTLGQAASIDDSAYAEIETVTQKIALQQEAVNVAYREFESTVKAFGEASEEAQEAYNKYLQEQIELAELNNKIAEKNKAIMDASYQNSMDWIEEQKYYNKMTLSDELAAYKRVQSRYAKGTEERKKMDREVYRLEQEIYEAQQQYIADVQSVQASANQKRADLEQEYADKVKSINAQLASDIQALNDQYLNALESREKSLYQSYGLFDEVKEKEEVSSETLMANLEDQVKEFGQWQDILDSLSARGLDSGLIEELQEMGPSAIAEIKALNSMSDSELEKYAALWSIKHAQAREQAVDELEGLRIETQNNIAQLRVEADRELNEYRAVWQTKMNQVTADTNAELERLRKAFAEKVGIIKKNTEQDMQEMADTAQEILTEAGWDEAGRQIVTGITGGVESEKSNFLNALTQMALEGVQAVKDTLEINSPSRVFRELGNYTGLGFVKGLTDYADKSYSAGANMADSATDGLSNAISMVAELSNGNFDMQPTIRPVLDLTDVTRAAGQVNGLFYPQQTMGLVGQASLSFAASVNKDSMTVNVDNDKVVRELRTLRDEMSAMTARLERMQIVLDTGTLVGQMADPLDAALGQKQAYKGRGI